MFDSFIQVAVGLRNQTVQVYDTGGSEDAPSYSFSGGEGPFKGIATYDGYTHFVTETFFDLGHY